MRGGAKKPLRTSSGLKNDYTCYSDEYFPTNILDFPNCRNRKKNTHPTEKPVDLLEYLIKTYTQEGEVVLDNCMGSGSTGIACLNTNRDFIGIELDSNYFSIAKERIENHRIDED